MMKKKLISLILCTVLCLSVFPTAYATESAPTETPPLETPTTDTAPADEPAPELDAPTCTCETACAEGAMQSECPVCSAEAAELSACAKYAVPTPSAEPTPAAPEATEARVQELINTLPGAEEITQDNRTEVEDKLTAIDEARLALTDEAHDALDFTRYEAAVAALNALNGTPGASEPETLSNADNSNIEKLFSAGTLYITLTENISGKELEYVQGGHSTTTLDLNGHTLSNTTVIFAPTAENNPHLKIINGTISGGRINTSGDTAISNVSQVGVSVKVVSNATLTLDNVSQPNDVKSDAISAEGNSKLIVNSGSYYGIKTVESATAKINGGTFLQGTISKDVSIRGDITGGTFDCRVFVSGGSISGGTFNNTVLASSSIKNGTFNGNVSVNDGSISGGTFNGSVRIGGGDTRLSGGEFKALESTSSVHVYLDSGYTLVGDDGSPADLADNRFDNVKVVQAGFSLSVSNPMASAPVYVGEGATDKSVTLTANVTGAGEGVKYQWYSGESRFNLTEISGATGSTYAASSGKDEEICYMVAATYGGKALTAYTSLKFSTSSIKVSPADSLVFTGEPLPLVKASDAGGFTMHYRLGKSGEYGTDIPTATNAGTYRVYFYGSSGEASSTPERYIDVTIKPKDPGDLTYWGIGSAYGCFTAENVLSKLKLKADETTTTYQLQSGETILFYFLGEWSATKSLGSVGGKEYSLSDFVEYLNSLDCNSDGYRFYATVTSDGGNIRRTTDTALISIGKAEAATAITATTPEYNGTKQVIARAKNYEAGLVFAEGEGYELKGGLPVATNAGTYTVNFTVTNSNYRQTSGSAEVSIAKKPITADFNDLQYGEAEKESRSVTLTLDDKVTVNGVIAGDELKLSGSVDGTLSSLDVGKSYFTVTKSNTLVLSGNSSGNYTLIGGSVTIIPRVISATVQSRSKEYNGTNTANITNIIFKDTRYSKSITSEMYTVSAHFADANVGNDKTVTFKITPKDTFPSCYVLSDGGVFTCKSSIKPKTVTATAVSVKDKEYDGTSTAELDITLSDVIDKDKDKLSASAKGTFADVNVGNDKLVTASIKKTGDITLSGEAAGNYELGDGIPSTNGLKGSITPKKVTVTGITAKGKTYDSKADAELDYADVVVSGLVGSDSVTVTASGAFADANAGENKAVTISGITLSGAQAGNYTASDSSQGSAIADISPRPITLQSKSLSKPYDGNALKPGSDEDKLVTVTSGKIVSGETLTYTFTGSQTDVGTSGNSFTVSGSTTAHAANYAISYDYGKLTVTVPATVGDEVKDLTAGNVTPSDKEKLEKALGEVKKYLGMSPSEDEKKELEAKKAQYEALLKQIDRVNRVQKGSLLATGDEARGKLWLGLFVLSMSLGTGLLALIKRRNRS